MIYGFETWYLGMNEIGILWVTEGAMVKSMSGVKLVYKKSTINQMQMLDLNEIIDQLAKINGVRWYGIEKWYKQLNEKGILFYSKMDMEKM